MQLQHLVAPLWIQTLHYVWHAWYCLKEECEENFQCIAHNIAKEDLDKGWEELILYSKTVDLECDLVELTMSSWPCLASVLPIISNN